MKFQANIHVMLKSDVADVQGHAIHQALRRHGDPVGEVRVGKYFEVEVEAEGEPEARAVIERLAGEAFSNPTIERFWYDLAPAPSGD